VNASTVLAYRGDDPETFTSELHVPKGYAYNSILWTPPEAAGSVELDRSVAVEWSAALLDTMHVLRSTATKLLLGTFSTALSETSITWTETLSRHRPEAEVATTRSYREFSRLYWTASVPARALAKSVLEQDAADSAWAKQVGAALRESDVAKLLDSSVGTVSADPRLLRLPRRDGRSVYPIFQFDGRRQVPGVADVVEVLTPIVATPFTIAAFLTGSHVALDGRTAIDLLRVGEIEPVILLARGFAERASV
jgi:hypothetical protein